MDRRDFLRGVGSVAALGAAQRAVGAAPGGGALGPAGPGRSAGAPRLHVGCQRWGSDPGHLGFLLRCGVRHICISPARSGPDGVWTAETCRDARKAVEDAGLTAESMYWAVPIDVLVPARRDAAIARCRGQIAAAGAGGIPCLAYTLNVRTWPARTGRRPGRGGGLYTAWDLATATTQPVRRSGIGPVEEEDMWARIAYFLKAVVPAAAEAKVRLACHPPDPPMPHPNPYKTAQVLDTVEGLKKFVQIADSPFHGLTFCQGCVWEFLPEKDKPAALYEAIRWFGTRGKIMQAHFRNLRGGRRHFVETYHDEGDIDMFRAVLAYKDAGYTGMLMPDHVPHHAEDPTELQHFAFAYGYIIGLVQAAYAGT